MPDILVTGMPRSGTTLLTSLLNAQPNTIALAEPIPLDSQGGRLRAVEEIGSFMRSVRKSALSHGRVPTKHVNGRITDNFAEPPNADGRLRQVLAQTGELHFEKPLSDEFTLVVKHPAEFTALADLLVHQFKLYALVRDPIAVLAAWQTVNMPVNRGHMPMMECFAPGLGHRLEGITHTLGRQVALIEFQLSTYSKLPPAQILRYEDMIADPKKTLAALCPAFEGSPELSEFDARERYPKTDFGALAAALSPILPLISRFYPDWEDRWAKYRHAGCGISASERAVREHWSGTGRQ